VLRNELDITLYKSRGTGSQQEKIPPLLSLTTTLARLIPFGELATGGGYKKYKHDCVAFGLSLIPELLRRRFDIIHIIDYPLAKVLYYLKRVFRFHGRLLLTNGCCIPPQYYPRVDHVHHVAEPLFDEALASGVSPLHLTQISCGVHTKRFEITMSRRELWKKYAISESTFVILAVTALKRMYKRVDHIIDEVSRLEGDVLLWLDGNLEEPGILELARQKLGDRCRITHVQSNAVGELYHLADVMVHACLAEAFGLAVVEALSTGLMVLAHNSLHYQWLIQDRDCLVDMNGPGRLTARLRELITHPEKLSLSAQARISSVRQRFDWQSLTPAYIKMYHKVAGQ
jgi:glycosyltransferase involved in cell wall biosynthesis